MWRIWISDGVDVPEGPALFPPIVATLGHVVYNALDYDLELGNGERMVSRNAPL